MWFDGAAVGWFTVTSLVEIWLRVTVNAAGEPPVACAAAMMDPGVGYGPMVSANRSLGHQKATKCRRARSRSATLSAGSRSCLSQNSDSTLPPRSVTFSGQAAGRQIQLSFIRWPFPWLSSSCCWAG